MNFVRMFEESQIGLYESREFEVFGICFVVLFFDLVTLVSIKLKVQCII